MLLDRRCSVCEERGVLLRLNREGHLFSLSEECSPQRVVFLVCAQEGGRFFFYNGFLVAESLRTPLVDVVLTIAQGDLELPAQNLFFQVFGVVFVLLLVREETE